MVKIIADSTCDLTKELLKEYDISILPLHVLCDDKEYLDGVDITQQELFTWAESNKTTPKTSAPGIVDAQELIRPFAEEGREVVCITISDGFSTTGNVFQLAADSINDDIGKNVVHIINSKNLSTGIGLLVMEAAVMAKEGESAEKIIEHINKLIPCVRASFVVDTLTYLHRGGRCSGVVALAGGALKLHPKIVVKNGKMEVAKKYRGNMKNVLIQYTYEMLNDFMNARKERVFITHAACDKEIVKAVHDYIEGLGIFEEIIETSAGCVISSHCGPGTLGVLFIEN